MLPCSLQRFFLGAGARWQGLPLRVLAPHFGMVGPGLCSPSFAVA